MAFEFDEAPEGAGFHAQKWEAIPPLYEIPIEGTISMHVADMDFRAAPCILKALESDVARGFTGYFGDTDAVNAAVTGWMDRKHGYTFDPGALRYTHGVIAAFAAILDAFSEPGDAIILFSPVYHAFYGKARAMGREIMESQLVERDGRYEMDLDSLAASLTGRERILTLCSPHNPGGRRWSRDEIRAVAEFCERHDLILISDEIHMDLAFPGVAHLPTAMAAPDYKHRLVTLTAASKGFSTAGGETGFAIVEDAGLQERLDPVLKNRGGTPNRYGMIMLKAAFGHGDDWSAAARAYIADNFAVWRERVAAIPGVRVMDMDATYLSWVDFRDTGCDDEEIFRRVVNDARIAASRGPQFGTGGSQHMRFNLGLPRSRMMTAIERLEAAFADLQ